MYRPRSWRWRILAVLSLQVMVLILGCKSDEAVRQAIRVGIQEVRPEIVQMGETAGELVEEMFAKVSELIEAERQSDQLHQLADERRLQTEQRIGDMTTRLTGLEQTGQERFSTLSLKTSERIVDLVANASADRRRLETVEHTVGEFTAFDVYVARRLAGLEATADGTRTRLLTVESLMRGTPDRLDNLRTKFDAQVSGVEAELKDDHDTDINDLKAARREGKNYLVAVIGVVVAALAVAFAGMTTMRREIGRRTAPAQLLAQDIAAQAALPRRRRRLRGRNPKKVLRMQLNAEENARAVDDAARGEGGKPNP